MSEERYDIKGRIGRGGIGAVYQAFDKRLQRDVAIKRLLPPDVSTLNDPAQADILEKDLENGVRKVGYWLRSRSVKIVDFPSQLGLNPFFNINSPAELQTAEDWLHGLNRP